MARADVAVQDGLCRRSGLALAPSPPIAPRASWGVGMGLMGRAYVGEFFDSEGSGPESKGIQGRDAALSYLRAMLLCHSPTGVVDWK